jgi:hypothetical protein
MHRACAIVRRRVFETYSKAYDASGYPYYYNHVTGVSSWTKPVPFAMGSYDLYG